MIEVFEYHAVSVLPQGIAIHPKVAHAPKTAAHKNHPKNILSEEKHAHRIVLALPKPNIAFKTTK